MCGAQAFGQHSESSQAPYSLSVLSRIDLSDLKILDECDNTVGRYGGSPTEIQQNFVFNAQHPSIFWSAAGLIVLDFDSMPQIGYADMHHFTPIRDTAPSRVRKISQMLV